MKHIINHHIVPRETFARTNLVFEQHKNCLESYIDQLLWWNRRVNLISRHVSRETVEKHVFHSLLLTSLNPFRQSDMVIDAGTGGGLPGLPLAISNPDKQFTLNDVVSKKVLATKQMARKLGISNTEFADRSIADIKTEKPFLLVSKHAFKINQLYEMTQGLAWEAMVFYKGLDFKEELSGLESPLVIDVHSLQEYAEDNFYKEKAIIFVRR